MAIAYGDMAFMSVELRQISNWCCLSDQRASDRFCRDDTHWNAIEKQLLNAHGWSRSFGRNFAVFRGPSLPRLSRMSVRERSGLQS